MEQFLKQFQSPSPGFVEASYRAVTTLSFVAPETAILHVVEQLRRDIDAQALGSLTDEDLAIWATPEGTTYVDGEHHLDLIIHGFAKADSCSVVQQEDR